MIAEIERGVDPRQLETRSRSRFAIVLRPSHRVVGERGLVHRNLGGFAERDVAVPHADGKMIAHRGRVRRG